MPVRAKLFRLIEETPHLTWQLLTKRPENVMRMVPEHWKTAFPENVWMGTSTENQEMADLRIGHLMGIPAKVLFLSCEPLVGPIDRVLGDNLGPIFAGGKVQRGIDWVIAGGESGPKARPMNPAWVRSIRDQCKAKNTPFLFKQWGEWAPASNFPDHIPSAESCDFEGAATGGDEVWRVGRDAAGNILDGQTHEEFPA